MIQDRTIRVPVCKAVVQGLVLCALISTVTPICGQEPAKDKPTEDEIREAREVAERFSQRLRETRDLQPLVNEFFVSDQHKSGIRDRFWRRSVNVNPPPDYEFTDEQLLTWYTLQFSLDHAAMIYAASKIPLKKIDEHKDIVPDDLKAYLKSVKLTDTEDKSALIKLAFQIREQTLKLWKNEFAKRPPEMTPEYQKNLAEFAQHANDPANPWGQIKVDVLNEEQGGAPLGRDLLDSKYHFTRG